MLTHLCREWFAKYHPWFPILHQITLLEELKTPCLYCSAHVLVFQAIAAVTAVEQRKRSDAIRDTIFLAVSKTLTLRSLQALLILTILDYGDGKIPQFYNLIAVCKRMSIQLGLRDLVVMQGGNFNKPSGSIPPRMLRLPQNLVHREECIRAYWITEALDSASTIGTAWNLLLNPRVESEWVPCRDDIWTAPESIDVESLQDEDSFSATFTLYVGLVCDVCHDVHAFLQTPFSNQKDWEKSAQDVYQKLMAWRDSHWRSNFLASPGGNHKTPFVAISLVIACTFHLARLSLFQRPVFTNLDVEQEVGVWSIALRGCFESCSSIASDIRTATDEELGHIHPQVSFCIFVTARFLLCKIFYSLLTLSSPHVAMALTTKVVCKKDVRTNALVNTGEYTTCMDAYEKALQICGQRWPFARRLGNVITTAMDELNHRTVVNPLGPLPVQFWDPQYLSLDVDEALRCWADPVRHPFQ